jgi:phospholipase/carboxylesterase
LNGPVSRRQVLAMASLAAALTPFACRWERRVEGRGRPRDGPGQNAAREGRLTARPEHAGGSFPPAEPVLGLQPLQLDTGRDGLLFVPSTYAPDRPHPLVVMLHGAGGDAAGGMSPFREHADQVGMILLAPDSRGRTWDALLGGYGRDVAFLDQALHQTLEHYAVDPGNVTVEGFSDGASYALGLGLANGDLFRRVVAFSPGFVPAGRRHGLPRVFISHGEADDVLPIDRCSRRIVPRLRSLDYDVRYREFPAGHAIPPDIVQEALAWWQEGS